LCRYFDGLKAVDDLNLQVDAGVVFGFLGPNGAGKTTTIRLLLGLLEPTSGSAQVLGFDLANQADQMRERVGVLLENDGLYSRLTAYGNLDFYGEINRLSATERQVRIQELLERLDLWDRRDEQAGTYSKGMRQKLALARALLHRPALLFLDEPTSGLDALSAVSLRDDLTDLARREGVTVFLTTHNLAEAEKVCDRVAVIHKGRLVAVGAPDEIGAQARQPRLVVAGRGFTPAIVTALEQLPVVERATLSDEGLTVHVREQGDSSELVSLLVNQGAQVEEVRKVGASLEEAFVTLMKEQEE
jgi:ABC-2 type transport system ATP-binding protein